MRRRIVSAAAILGVAIVLGCPGCAAVGRGLGLGEAPWGPTLQPSGRDDYPPLAKELGLTGRVGLECWVDSRGAAREIVILESGGLVLDDAARLVDQRRPGEALPLWSHLSAPRQGRSRALRGPTADRARHRFRDFVKGTSAGTCAQYVSY